jgi:hypothetical protein
MPQLMLVNPAKRRKSRRKTSSRKKRSTRRMRRNPIARASTRRNPVKRVRRRKYRRNPIGGKLSMRKVLNTQVMPALTQAGGALAVDLGYGYLSGYLPAMLTTGAARHATKGLMAILLSTVAANFVKSTTANQMAVGALTVTIHDAAKEVLATTMPSLPLGYYNYAPVQGLNYYTQPALTASSGLNAYANSGAMMPEYDTSMGLDY